MSDNTKTNLFWHQLRTDQMEQFVYCIIKQNSQIITPHISERFSYIMVELLFFKKHNFSKFNYFLFDTYLTVLCCYRSSCSTAMYLGGGQTPTSSGMAMELPQVDSTRKHLLNKRKASFK